MIITDAMMKKIEDSTSNQVLFGFAAEDNPSALFSCGKIYNAGKGKRHATGNCEHVLECALSNENVPREYCVHVGWDETLAEVSDAVPFSQIWRREAGVFELERDYKIMWKNLLKGSIHLIKQGFDLRTITADMIVFRKGDTKHHFPKIMDCMLSTSSSKDKRSQLATLAQIFEEKIAKGRLDEVDHNPLVSSFHLCLKGGLNNAARMTGVVNGVQMEEEILGHPIFKNYEEQTEYLVRVFDQMCTNKFVKLSTLRLDMIVTEDQADARHPARQDIELDWINPVFKSAPPIVQRELTARGKYYNLYHVSECVRFCRNMVTHVNDDKKGRNADQTSRTISKGQFGVYLRLVWPRLVPYLFLKYGRCEAGGRIP